MLSTAARAFNPAFVSRAASRSTLTARFMSRKAGVSSPEELKAFVADAGTRLMVVDVRNPDASAEPGDQKSLAVAALPSDTSRPQAVHLVWDRESDGMSIPDAPIDTPIITHCGGGGRGQKAMDFLMANGFTSVLNGGGPKETECWAEFGDK
jgi:rhodanese-related sulfurtransferase